MQLGLLGREGACPAQVGRPSPSHSSPAPPSEQLVPSYQNYYQVLLYITNVGRRLAIGSSTDALSVTPPCLSDDRDNIIKQLVRDQLASP